MKTQRSSLPNPKIFLSFKQFLSVTITTAHIHKQLYFISLFHDFKTASKILKFPKLLQLIKGASYICIIFGHITLSLISLY